MITEARTLEYLEPVPKSANLETSLGVAFFPRDFNRPVRFWRLDHDRASPFALRPPTPYTPLLQFSLFLADPRGYAAFD